MFGASRACSQLAHEKGKNAKNVMKKIEMIIKKFD